MVVSLNVIAFYERQVSHDAHDDCVLVKTSPVSSNHPLHRTKGDKILKLLVIICNKFYEKIWALKTNFSWFAAQIGFLGKYQFYRTSEN